MAITFDYCTSTTTFLVSQGFLQFLDFSTTWQKR